MSASPSPSLSLSLSIINYQNPAAGARCAVRMSGCPGVRMSGVGLWARLGRGPIGDWRWRLRRLGASALHRLGDQGRALGSLGAAELGSKAPMHRAYWHVPRCRRVRFEAAADIRHGLFIYFQHRLNFPKPPKTFQSGWSWLVSHCHPPPST
jgi:hypothetical protein